MDIIESVKNIVKPFLDEQGFLLYDVELTKEFGYKILRVLVDKKGGIDVDELALVNDYLSPKLDELEVYTSEYMLEVSSPGAEKELRTSEEVNDSIGEYVNVKTKEQELEGYLIDASDETLKMEINLKGRIKEVTVNRIDIKKIRLAVKF